MLKKFSLLVSYISEPFLTSFLAFGLVLLRLEGGIGDKFVWGILAVIFAGLPPTLTFIYEKRSGKIGDWFITNRLERRDVHIAWIFGSAVLSLVFWQLAVPRLLIATVLSLFLLSLVITIATLLWKISVHVVGMTFLILILLLVYSSNFLPGVLIIGLIAWTRIYLGHHTLSQVTAAALLTVLVVYYTFYLFGLATF